jgi:hypothetical protein
LAGVDNVIGLGSGKANAIVIALNDIGVNHFFGKWRHEAVKTPSPSLFSARRHGFKLYNSPMRFLILVFCILCTAACAPNETILKDNQNVAQATPQQEPTPTVPAARMTFAQLIDRVAKAPPDSYLYPCNLNAYSDVGRANLATLAKSWTSKEDDARYIVTPSTGCVCPGICVVALEDTKGTAPKNFGLIAMGDPAEGDQTEGGYQWIARNLDLSDAELNWTGVVPQVTFRGNAGAIEKTCSIEKDKSSGRFTARCENDEGKPAGTLQ